MDKHVEPQWVDRVRQRIFDWEMMSGDIYEQNQRGDKRAVHFILIMAWDIQQSRQQLANGGY